MNRPAPPPDAPAVDGDGGYDELAAFLRHERGLVLDDHPGARRRIDERRAAAGAPDLGAYLALLASDPAEVARLLDAVLVAVSSLRRDPEVWEYLERQVLPPLLAAKGPDEPVRVWSAGCGSGEEAYSLAVLLAEALGDDAFRHRVTVYATDADPEALSRARPARYRRAELVAAFGEDRADRFFEPLGDESMFRQDLRRSVVFGHHDLVADPPITHIDLLACRNTLIYLPRPVREAVLDRLASSLVPGGTLFLGAGEAPSLPPGRFEEVDGARRLYRRAAAPVWGPRAQAALLAAFMSDPVPTMVVGPEGEVLAVNQAGRARFGSAVGGPTPPEVAAALAGKATPEGLSSRPLHGADRELLGYEVRAG